MNNQRTQPKSSYIFDADWQDLYLLTAHWKSDLLFYKDDLEFLHDLLGKYIKLKTNDKKFFKTIQNTSIETTFQCSNLLKKMNKHLVDLAAIIIHPENYDSHKFRTKHQQLEDAISNFENTLRTHRKKVFEATKIPN